MTAETALFALQDPGYHDFQCALMPTIDPATVIGVRTPDLRRYARTFQHAPEAAAFLRTLPHRWYEENNLHCILISAIPDFDDCMEAVNAFLPYVDNWATCDMLSPKALARCPEQLMNAIPHWLGSGHTYTIRFGIGQLMHHFLDADFTAACPAMVASVQSGEYYVNMMRAWYFATALAKQYESILPWLSEHRLDRWTHNKSIQKAIESRRISPEHKQELKKLRWYV